MGGSAEKYTLYWSSLDMYEGCPQQFLWAKGWGVIDVGGGPGRGKPKAEKRSEHHAVMGTVIQAVIERFYNDELWKLLAPPVLRDRMLELADENFALELARRYIDWRVSIPQEEMRQLIRDGILGYIRTLKAHKFLGPYARAEVELLGYIDKYNPIGGRADVIIRRETEPTNGVTILDGKNSKRYKDGKGGTMTYTDPDQLRWYALLFYLCYRKMPDHLGFVYYRYPYGMPILDEEGQETGKIESGVDWVPCTKDDIKGLARRAADARKGMNKEHFDARPEPKRCKFCDFESECQARGQQRASNRRAQRSPSAALDNLQGAGMLTFGGSKPKGQE